MHTKKAAIVLLAIAILIVYLLVFITLCVSICVRARGCPWHFVVHSSILCACAHRLQLPHFGTCVVNTRHICQMTYNLMYI